MYWKYLTRRTESKISAKGPALTNSFEKMTLSSSTRNNTDTALTIIHSSLAFDDTKLANVMSPHQSPSKMALPKSAEVHIVGPWDNY